MDEVVFQTAEEAFQKLADLTGKKVMVPDKAEPTIAEDSEQEEETVVSEDVDSLRENFETKGKKYLDIADQLKTMDKDMSDLCSSL